MKDKKISLKEYFDMRIELIYARILTMIEDIDRRTLVAKESMEYRLAGMNEFRNSMKDQESHFVRRLEMKAELDLIKKDLQELRDFRVASQSLASQRAVNITLFIATLGIILGIVSIIIQMV
ncbi:MAG: hypothetical protein WC476_01075 [Phycisphaerae bacterium]|jgi:hypothetical protein